MRPSTTRSELVSSRRPHNWRHLPARSRSYAETVQHPRQASSSTSSPSCPPSFTPDADFQQWLAAKRARPTPSSNTKSLPQGQQQGAATPQIPGAYRGREAMELSRSALHAFNKGQRKEEFCDNYPTRNPPHWSLDINTGSGLSALGMISDEDEGSTRERKRRNRKKFWCVSQQCS